MKRKITLTTKRCEGVVKSINECGNNVFEITQFL